jgi:hypothetical protein
MFPSILFIALMITTLAFLGISVLIGLFICKRYSRNNTFQNIEPLTPPAIAPTPPVTNLPRPEPPTLHPGDLDALKKEVILGTNIAIYSLAFGLVIFAISNLLNAAIVNKWIGFALWFYALIILSFAEPIVRRWITRRPNRFFQSMNFARILFWVILISGTIVILIKLISIT